MNLPMKPSTTLYCEWTWEDHERKPAREWATLKLIDFPETESGVIRLSKRESWQALGAKYARKRRGRGGGWEYHVSCLPEAAQRDFLQRRKATEAKTEIAERAETEASVIETSSETLSARHRRVMEARAAVLREVDRRSAMEGQSRRQAILSLIADMAWDLKCRAAGRHDQCVLDEAFLQMALIANDRGKRRKALSRTSIYAWIKDFEAGGVVALAPVRTRTDRPLMEVYPWLMPFMGFYARPSKPTMAHALDQYQKSPDRVGDAPSYEQVRRALKSLEGTPDHLMAFKGREGPLALKARLAYVSRSTEGLEPTTIYTADGKTFDAEVQHPRSGKPFRPEITTVIDVVTRKVVGWSVALDETAEAVADAVRHSVERCGVPAIFYSDRGKGYKNKRISMTTLSLCSRLGISATQSLPYNSQARGVIERAHGTIWHRLSKEYPSYMGKDMDKEAAKQVFRDSRKALAIIEGKKQVVDPKTQAKSQVTYSKLIVGWQQFLDDVAAAVAAYNDTRHTGLGRIRDPENGRMRYPSPNELWAQFEATGFEPFYLDEGEGDDLFRPYEKRRTRRGLIELHTNEYFSLDLEPFHGKDVLVGFDIHDAAKVWVREIAILDGKEEPGRLICVAAFAGNKQRYVPVSYQQKAEEKRLAGRLKRNNNRTDAIEAEARPQLDAQQMVVLPDVAPAPDPLPAPAGAEVEDAVVLATTPPQKRFDPSNTRNPFGDVDIDLAWDIVDAPEGTEITKGHRELMHSLLKNPTGLVMLKDCKFPTRELRKRLAAAEARDKAKDNGDDDGEPE